MRNETVLSEWTSNLDLFHFFSAFLEIFIIAVILNYLLSFLWKTRGMDVVFGFLAFLLLFAAASLFNLPVIQTLMYNIISVVALAIFIIFQPEIRLALSRFWNVKGRKINSIDNLEHFLENLTQSVYRLAEKKIGALIVLENQDSLEDYANKAVRLEGQFSSELLESIFMTTTPLHDGAIICRGITILAASVILPLADDTYQLARAMGTRHRAALGMSQTTDALVIVVSEESGRVSVARDGMMTRGVKSDRLRGIIRSIYHAPQIEKTWRQLLWPKH